MARKRSNRFTSSSKVSIATLHRIAREHESPKLVTESHQHVHQQMLAVNQPDSLGRSEGFYKEVMMPIAGGRNQDYCHWWHDQTARQDTLSLFSVRLIGDAGSPQLFTLMAYLAYCRYACNHLSVAK